MNLTKNPDTTFYQEPVIVILCLKNVVWQNIFSVCCFWGFSVTRDVLFSPSSYMYAAVLSCFMPTCSALTSAVMTVAIRFFININKSVKSTWDECLCLFFTPLFIHCVTCLSLWLWSPVKADGLLMQPTWILHIKACVFVSFSARW